MDLYKNGMLSAYHESICNHEALLMVNIESTIVKYQLGRFKNVYVFLFYRTIKSHNLES